MADPVKISDLPAIGSVQPNDILPIVDSALTQTSRCTASQIAQLGGGPPGDGTVTTGKIGNGQVTYPKIQNVTGDRVLGKTSGASGTVEEIPCTAFARSVLAAADGNAARALINDTPTFSGTMTVNGNANVNGNLSVTGSITGPVRTPDGTAAAPAYSFADDTDTGLARLSGGGSVSVVSDGVEQFRIGDDTIQTKIAGLSGLYPVGQCRTYVMFHSLFRSGYWGLNVTSVSRLGVGWYQVNFGPKLMPDTNYATVVSCAGHSTGFYGKIINVDSQYPPQTSYVRVRCVRGDVQNDFQDMDFVSVAIFR